MLLLVGMAAALVIFWLGSKEKPLYKKTYYRDRSAGVFRTEYGPGFQEYIEHVEKEVKARFTVGPFGPTDDLYTDLYHPEVEENWRRELSGHRFRNRLRDVLHVMFGIVICASVADFAVQILTHPHRLLSDLLSALDDQRVAVKLVAWAFAVALCVYTYRSRNSISRTQGYLDGYSDRCIGPERAMRIIGPPSPHT